MRVGLFRDLRARTCLDMGVVHPKGEGMFEVENGRGQAYTVDVKAGSCTCPDHAYRGDACKRLIACQLASGSRVRMVV